MKILVTELDLGLAKLAFNPVLLALAEADFMARNAGDAALEHMGDYKLVRVTVEFLDA